MLLYFVIIALSSAYGRTYDPRELAVAFDSSGASYWNVPFLLCLSKKTSNLTEIASNSTDVGPEGIFALPRRFRQNCSEPLDVYEFPEIARDVACVQNILKAGNPADEIRKIYSFEVEFDSCFDWWHELSAIPPPASPSCDDSTNLTINLLLAVFDFLLAFLCFVLFLYVKNPKCTRTNWYMMCTCSKYKIFRLKRSLNLK